MKKFQILGTVLLLSVVTTLLVACQKEQDGITNEVSKTTDEESIIAIQEDAGNIPGIISQNEAAALAARYASARVNKSTAVSFDVKDIQKYLNVLKRTGSKKIYVNFGLYNNGRLTVFFSGDKRQSTGSIRNSNEEDGPSEFLNHGGLLP